MIRNIVFSAGSIGGLSFIGAWKALEEHQLVDNITNFSGCSAGAIMAFLTSIGYTSSELTHVALKFKYSDIADFQMLNAYDNMGLDTGRGIERLLRKLLYHKTGKYDLTFKEHHTITGKMLYITAVCVEEDRSYYFSRKTCPDWSVISAIRMSISLPFLIAPVIHNGMTFIDGGFHDPCPVKMFSPDDTIVIYIRNNGGTSESDRFMNYLSQIFNSVYRRMNQTAMSAMEKYRVIYLKTGLGGMSINVKKSQRKILIKIGYQELKEFITHRLC